MIRNMYLFCIYTLISKEVFNLSTEEDIFKKHYILEKLDELLYNGFCYKGDSETIYLPDGQGEIVELLNDIYNIGISQPTVSNYIKELNYTKDKSLGMYVKKDIGLYSEHREVLLSYLKIKDYTIEFSPDMTFVSINTEHLNTNLLYELIIESYPKGYILHMIKGYNILKVTINENYNPPVDHQKHLLFESDISEYARKSIKPKVTKSLKKNRDV